MTYIKITAVILLMSVSVLLAVSCRSDEQDLQSSAETSPEEISAPESEEPDAVPELQIDSTEAEYMKRNNITDMNEWLHSQGLDPFATTVFFEDCVYMCDPDAEIGENRADYVKGTKDELLSPEPESLKLVNPGVTDGVLTVTRGTVNLLVPELTPVNAKSKTVFMSSDPDIVSADGAYITALKPGEATIKAITENGLSESVRVIVSESPYDAGALKEALKKHGEAEPGIDITSELRDLDFDGVPELVEYISGMTRRSQWIRVYRLTGDSWDHFITIAGNGSFQLMIDNGTGSKNYCYNGYIHDTDFSGISGAEGTEGGHYIFKLSGNEDHIGSVLLSCESDGVYFDMYDKYVFFRNVDEYTGHEYLTDDISQYADCCNAFYRRHTPVDAYTKITETVRFGMEDPETSPSARQYKDGLLDLFERYDAGAETAAEKRAPKLKRQFLTGEAGERMTPELVYMPAGGKELAWYAMPDDAPAEDDDFIPEQNVSKQIYAVSGENTRSLYVPYLP